MAGRDFAVHVILAEDILSQIGTVRIGNMIASGRSFSPFLCA
jgi:hypothetical protein